MVHAATCVLASLAGLRLSVAAPMKIPGSLTMPHHPHPLLNQQPEIHMDMGDQKQFPMQKQMQMQARDQEELPGLQGDFPLRPEGPPLIGQPSSPAYPDRGGFADDDVFRPIVVADTCDPTMTMPSTLVIAPAEVFQDMCHAAADEEEYGGGPLRKRAATETEDDGPSGTGDHPASSSTGNPNPAPEQSSRPDNGGSENSDPDHDPEPEHKEDEHLLPPLASAGAGPKVVVLFDGEEYPEPGPSWPGHRGKDGEVEGEWDGDFDDSSDTGYSRRSVAETSEDEPLPLEFGGLADTAHQDCGDGCKCDGHE